MKTKMAISVVLVLALIGLNLWIHQRLLKGDADRVQGQAANVGVEGAVGSGSLSGWMRPSLLVAAVIGVCSIFGRPDSGGCGSRRRRFLQNVQSTCPTAG